MRLPVGEDGASAVNSFAGEDPATAGRSLTNSVLLLARDSHPARHMAFPSIVCRHGCCPRHQRGWAWICFSLAFRGSHRCSAAPAPPYRRDPVPHSSAHTSIIPVVRRLPPAPRSLQDFRMSICSHLARWLHVCHHQRCDHPQRWPSRL